MRVSDFHAVDFNKDEVVEFVRPHSTVEVRHNFTNCSRLSGSRCSRNIDAGAGALGDGCFEMRVYEAELGFSKEGWWALRLREVVCEQVGRVTLGNSWAREHALRVA